MEINKIHNIDCMGFIEIMEDKFVDLILTDPPYDIVVNKKGYGSGFYKKTDHLAKIDEIFGTNFNPTDFLTRAMRVTKNGILNWCSQRQLLKVLDFARDNKLKWDLQFWHKENPCPNHFNHLLVDTEYCPRVFKSGAYFNNELEYWEYKKYFLAPVQSIEGHPTPKPLEIIKAQLKVFSKEGDLIFDPYMGSGTTAVACMELNRNYIGCEINRDYFLVCEERIRKAKQQLKLF